MEGSGPTAVPSAPAWEPTPSANARAGGPGEREHRQVGQEAELRDGEHGAARRAGVERLIDRDHEVPVDEEGGGEQRAGHRQAGHQRHEAGLDRGPQVGAGPARMLAGAGEPGDGVDADQPAPGAGLAAGADHHAEPERDQRDEGGGPEADADVVRAADEAGGQAERGVHQPGAEQRLPELVRVGGPGQPPARAPGEQERDEGEPERGEREDAGFRLGRGADADGVQQQRDAVDQQPGLAGEAGQDVGVAVQETGGGPHGDNRCGHHQGGNDGCLRGLEGSLQPQRHRKSTFPGLISAQFHRVPWCHVPGFLPVPTGSTGRFGRYFARVPGVPG